MRVCVLTNLRAGRKNVRLQRVLSFLKDRPDIPHLETENYQHVPEALAELKHKGMDILAVNGGDGTLQHTLTSLLKDEGQSSPPLIAPLCGGRTNMNALVLGSQRDPVAALSTLLTAAQNGSMKERVVNQSVLRVDLSGNEEVQYGMCLGVGVLHRAIDLKHQLLPQRRLQGLPGAALFVGSMLARVIFGSNTGMLTPDRMTITLDQDRQAPQDYLLVLLSSLHRLLFNLQPFWGKEDAPIRFTSILPDVRRTPVRVFRILRGQPPVAQAERFGYVSRNVHAVEFQLDCGLILDGELFAPIPGRTVRVTADQRLQFVRTTP